jgi:hypothetical protein
MMEQTRPASGGKQRRNRFGLQLFLRPKLRIEEPRRHDNFQVKVKVMTLNTHATPEATVNLFRRKRHSGRGGLWAGSPLLRAFGHRRHSPAEAPFGLRSGEAGLELPELLRRKSGPGEALSAKGGAIVEEPLRSEARLAAALDDEDEDEDFDEDDDLDEEDDDLEEEDDDEEELDDEDEDGLDEDEYLDDEDEEEEEDEEE